MDDIFETLSKYPWLVGAGVIIGLYLLLRGGSSQPVQAGTDYSATLASQKIATDAAVALAGIQAQRDAVQGSQNIALTQARRDIILGAQNIALADKSLTTDLAITSLNNTVHMADSSQKGMVDMFTVATGFMLGNRDLENQADAAQKAFDLGMSGIMSDRITTSMALTYQDAASQRGDSLTYNLANLNAVLTQYLDQSYYDNLTNVTDNELRLNTQADNTDITINQAQQDTVRLLGHQQVKIAKARAKSDLFGSILGLASNLGTAAMGRIM